MEKKISIVDFPETTTKDGVKVYVKTSYETQIAILSHYLHTFDGRQDMEALTNRDEILRAIRDYIEILEPNIDFKYSIAA